MLFRILAVITLLVPVSAMSADPVPPLVSPAWVAGNSQEENVRILDLQSSQGYRQAHIPDSVNTDYARWRTGAKSPMPGVLPPVGQMESLIGGLGIDNDTHVVIASLGRSAGDLASAARIFWSFKALGHDKVSILDGGLIAYAQARLPLSRTPRQVEVRTFKAAPRADFLPGKREVRAALEQGVQLVDNRSRAEYLGVYRGGGKARPGTIPGAVNLPYDWLTVNGGAQLHSLNDLRTLFKSAGVGLDGEQIQFCQSGNRAALAWFVSHELFGNDKAKLYDASMAEWAVDPALPMKSEVRLQCKTC